MYEPPIALPALQDIWHPFLASCSLLTYLYLISFTSLGFVDTCRYGADFTYRASLLEIHEGAQRSDDPGNLR
jgi:hypothetical protein